MGLAFKVDGSATGAVKAVQDFHKALKDVESGAEGAAKSAAKVEQAAKRIAEQANPQQKYNRQMHDLADLVKRGKVSLEDAEAVAKRYGVSLDRAGQSGAQAFGQAMISNIGAVATSIVSATGLLSLFREELNATAADAQKRLQSQLTGADADRALRQNIVSLSPQEREQVLAAKAAISVETGVSPDIIANALTGSISSSTSTTQAINQTALAAQFDNTAEGVRAIAGGIGDIINTSKITEEKDALGFLTTVQAAARIESPVKTAQNLGKVLGAYTNERAGGTAENAAALFAAVTKGAVDPQGEVSRSAVNSLVEKTAKFFADEKGFKADQIDTVDERIALLFKDKTLARKFLDSTTFEAGAAGGINKLLLGDETIRGVYQDTLSRLGDREQRIKSADDALAFVNSGDLQTTAAGNKGLRAALDRHAERTAGEGLVSDELREDLIGLIAKNRRVLPTTARAALFARTGETLDFAEAESVIDRELKGGRGDDELKQLFREMRDTLRELNGKNESRRTVRQR